MRTFHRYHGLTGSLYAYRFCSRCASELTDPASVECGVGPICRGKDNHLYSKTIPANYALAFAKISCVDSSTLSEENRERFSALKNSVCSKATKVAERAVAEKAEYASHRKGMDLRDEIRTIDWLLSFSMHPKTKALLVDIVRDLGYVALAGVLSGKASTGESKISFDDSTGMLKLQGSRNKAGIRAFRALAGSRSFAKEHLIPARFFEQFRSIVLECWPCFNENLDTVVSQAREWWEKNMPATKTTVVSLPAPVVPVRVPSKPQATFTRILGNQANEVNFGFEWVGNLCWKLVNEIKNRIPYQNRKYNPTTKQWTFRAQDVSIVKEIINQILPNEYEIVEG